MNSIKTLMNSVKSISLVNSGGQKKLIVKVKIPSWLQPSSRELSLVLYGM